MKTEQPQTIYLKDYKPSDYLISHIELDFKLAANQTQTHAVLSIKPNNQTGAPLVLNGEDLKLITIAINGAALKTNEYGHKDNFLTIHNPPTKPFTLTTLAETNPEANTSLSGLYLTHDTYCTQCEAEGFRKITFSLDRPDVLSTYNVRLEANKNHCPILLSNGNLIEQGAVKGKTNSHYAIWQDPHPKPTYLFALVAGDLDYLSDSYLTADGNNVALNIYVERGNKAKAEYAMGALKRSFKWDEERFGRIYDLDIFNIVAVPHFNMGAMENKGLNVFNDKYILASAETATDMDFELIEAVIGHEYFHNWTGNRITCRDWFQLCLKEGLTVFRDAEFTSDLRSRAVKRIDDVKGLRAGQFAEDAGPMAHPCRPDSFIEIDNFYTATVYRKGAEVVRALYSLVGKDGFRASMDYYFENFDGQAATVKDFLNCFEQVTGRDLTQFEIWYSQAGTPTLKYSTIYNEQAQTYALTIEQSCKPTPGQEQKHNYHMPIKLGLLAKDGTDMPLIIAGKPVANGMVEITEAKTTFTFEQITEKPVISFLRDFSVPVNVETQTDIDDLLFLMANDNDPFNRWQAGQSVAMQAIISLINGAPEADILDGRLATAICKSINNKGLDAALRALILTLPSLPEIGLKVGKNIDYSAIHAARESLATHIATQNQADMLKLYQQFNQDQNFEPDAKGAGVRAFRNALLRDLNKIDNTDHQALLVSHYKNANNMVDMMGSLSVMTNLAGFDAAAYVNDFYQKFKHDHLVIDKWFALQGRAINQQTLAAVKKLTTHEQFSFETPNNVYSLIGSFVSGNPVGFHAQDGSGYEFLADTIIKLDRFNPQIAARMLTPLRSWKSLEPKRQELAKQALEKIIDVNNLSANTFEIASKSLNF
ncbi:MAG: aminopeptidase N [Alphaproteobacteria bacterium]|nr:aminopeptidase N [Alphaproteobacteria bacterium]